jgi:hypothetical protein
MGNEAGVARLQSSMGQYVAQSDGGGLNKTPGVIEPSKGFELKSGSNGRSAGAALPLDSGPGMGYQQLPATDGKEDDSEVDAEAAEESRDDPKGGFSDPAGSHHNG